LNDSNVHACLVQRNHFCPFLCTQSTRTCVVCLIYSRIPQTGEVTSQLSVVTLRSLCYGAAWPTVLKLSDDDLSRYLNKIESVPSSKCSYYQYTY